MTQGTDAPAGTAIARTTLSTQRTDGGDVFPLAYASQDPSLTLARACDWVSEHKDTLKVEATRHGAVLLRGLPVASPEDFDAVMTSLDIPNFPYKKSLSNAVRVNFTERVFSANEAPPTIQIFFHHEMAQTPLYPRWIAFYCQTAAPVGGATPLCRSDVLYQKLAESCPQFLEDCETKGLLYTNVMPGVDDAQSGMGRSWQSTLGVTTKEQAEARLAELGYSYKWLDGDCLKATTPVLPAVLEVSPGRRTFFNQLVAAYSGWKDSRNDPSEAIRLGDGTKLDPEGVRTAIRLAEELAFDMPWRDGDVVLIDNEIAMHARRTFEGKRKVLASLASMKANRFAG